MDDRVCCEYIFLMRPLNKCYAQHWTGSLRVETVAHSLFENRFELDSIALAHIEWQFRRKHKKKIYNVCSSDEIRTCAGKAAPISFSTPVIWSTRPQHHLMVSLTPLVRSWPCNEEKLWKSYLKADTDMWLKCSMWGYKSMHIAAGSLLLEIRFFYIMVVSFNF